MLTRCRAMNCRVHKQFAHGTAWVLEPAGLGCSKTGGTLRPRGWRRGRLRRLLVARGRRDRDSTANAVGGLLRLGCVVLRLLRWLLLRLLRRLLRRRRGLRPGCSLRMGTKAA